MSLVLTKEGQELADEFDLYFSDRGCTCFLSAPCSYCTHPGNPICLENSDDLWEDSLIAEIRKYKK